MRLPSASPVSEGMAVKRKISTKKFDVVKFTDERKIRKLQNVTKCIMLIHSFSPQDFSAVENSCGEVCGDCGKLWVFHRYFSLFPSPPPVHKLRRWETPIRLSETLLPNMSPWDYRRQPPENAVKYWNSRSSFWNTSLFPDPEAKIFVKSAGFFRVSAARLRDILMENGVTPSTGGTPCREK